MRVLWLLKGLDVGGIERLLCWAAEARDAATFDCEAAYVSPKANALVPELEATGVPVHSLDAAHELDLGWGLRLRRLLISGRFDILHPHSPYVAGVARSVVLSLPARLRPRIVTTEHNVWSDYPLPTRLLNGVTYPLDARHIAVSTAVKNSIVPPLRKNVEVVIHGVPVSAVRKHLANRDEARRALGVDSSQIVIGTVANLRPPKGYPDLLRAARRVLQEQLPVTFLAVGQGPQRSELQALHLRMKLGDAFRFLGYRDDAIHVLAACDLFVLASHYEGVPVAVIEALAMGLPVIATRVGVVPEVITPGVEGVLTSPGQPDRLAESIRTLATNAGLRESMAKAAYRRGGQLDIERTVRRIETIYREVADAS